MTEAAEHMDDLVAAGYMSLPNEIRSTALGVGLARKGDDPPHVIFVAMEVNAFGTPLQITFEGPPERMRQIIESLQEAIKLVEDGEPSEDGH